jgi:hypothetical protein
MVFQGGHGDFFGVYYILVFGFEMAVEVGDLLLLVFTVEMITVDFKGMA